MIKQVTRILSVAIAVLSFWCFAYPQAPRSILAGFIESREAASKLANQNEPAPDVVLAKTALAMFDAKIARSQLEVNAAGMSKPDFDSAFFEAEPTSPSDRLPTSAAKVQPVDAGPEIQTNPFFD